MKFRINPLHSALLATFVMSGPCQFSQAAALDPTSERNNEVRAVIIDGHPVVESNQGTVDVFVAQSEPGSNKREVKVITTGRDFNVQDMPGMPDIDVIVSNAVAEAFSGGSVISAAKNIKNAPYSAEVISEKIQTLPDGNQITRKTTTMSFRDSAGRTRQETRDAKGEIRSIQVNDVVEGSRYVIHPSRKTATKIDINKDLQKRIEEAREKAKLMAKDGLAHIIERSGPRGEEIIVKRVELAPAEGNKGSREEVKVVVTRGTDPKYTVSESGTVHMESKQIEHRNMYLAELAPLNKLGNLFMDSKWSSKSTTTQLGTKDIEGVRAEGKNVSYTIAAGEIGNKNPIIVITETWTSPELQVVMYSKHSDPRVGDTIYRLANVRRVEQPA
ncbi:MAG: hypothetical protein ABI583_14885, partial [Betaproteobacteria bacterium]